MDGLISVLALWHYIILQIKIQVCINPKCVLICGVLKAMKNLHAGFYWVTIILKLGKILSHGKPESVVVWLVLSKLFTCGTSINLLLTCITLQEEILSIVG